MQTMYPGMVNSPLTSLIAAIDDTQNIIEVTDGSKLPDAPNLATIGGGENAETVLYTGKSGNTLTGVTRGFQGTARAWSAGTQIGRFFTEYDYAAMKANIEGVNTALTEATASATANQLIKRDANGRAKVAAPSAADDIARKDTVDALATTVGNTYAKKVQEALIAPVLLNGWVNYGPPYGNIAYFKDEFGIVHINGFIKSGAIASGTTILTLPPGYRLSSQRAFNAVSSNGSSYLASSLSLDQTGNLAVLLNCANAWLLVDIHFRAEQ